MKIGKQSPHLANKILHCSKSNQSFQYFVFTLLGKLCGLKHTIQIQPNSRPSMYMYLWLGDWILVFF